VETKRLRGASSWNPADGYAITIGFSLCPRAHGNQKLDIENFVKPSVDALAAGLFCGAEVDAAQIQRYDYDDSGFTHLLVQRLSDAPSEEEEGAAFCVSAASV